MGAYYNEHDPFAAAWLRELIKANLIAPGEVDERSIEDVESTDLKGFTQCHFFAGIGVWSYALRNAGWSDDTPVWTGSCPCQGFSDSGARRGFSDKRHLWPAWFRLIEQCAPDTIIGEQVASEAGLAWLDVVSADLERESYTFGAADLCAAGVGAPHIRQRLWFVAHAARAGSKESNGSKGDAEFSQSDGEINGTRFFDAALRGRKTGSMGHTANNRLAAEPITGRCASADSSQPKHEHSDHNAVSASKVIKLADTRAARLQRREQRGTHFEGGSEESHGPTSEPSGSLVSTVAEPNSIESENRELQRGGRLGQLTENPLAGFWSNAEWIYCRDGKYRPVEPGTFPLAHGAAARVGRLRGYGNAINAEVAQAFIEASIEALSEMT